MKRLGGEYPERNSYPDGSGHVAAPISAPCPDTRGRETYPRLSNSYSPSTSYVSCSPRCWEHRRKTQNLPLRRGQSLMRRQSGHLQCDVTGTTEQSGRDRGCGSTKQECPAQPGEIRECFPRW